MGDGTVSALVKDVLQKLAPIATEEFWLVWGLKDDLETLKDVFNQIRAVLEDAEEKRMKEKAVQLWLQSLRSASLTMENLLDDFSTEVMLRKLYKELGIIYEVRAFFSCHHNQLMFLIRMAHEVKKIRKKFDDIADRKTKLNLIRGTTSSVDERDGGEMPNRETSSLIHDSSFIFGRKEEIDMITKKICKPNVGKNDVNEIRVYAIWGMGGLGKTTLAQSVYNHERVNKHFELKCWIYVSEKFQVKELIKGIIESIDENKSCRHLRLEVLQKLLQSKLRGKRFLIILDDVWIEESERMKWEQLSQTLSCGAEGSIVVMTTRSKTCSRMMAKLPELQHELGCLSKEDAWSLFEKLAFAEGREGGYRSELEPVGKKIVEKCKGLPLAVKTLGGLMWSKSSMSDWERVNNSNLWELQENNILPALKLSYDNLLPHLKRCFAYCCMFTKGYMMEKDVLIQLWVSNGFIPPRGEVSLYVLGEEVLNCLAWRSFFQVDKDDNKYVHGMPRYKIHDLMHDTSRYVSRHDCSIIEPGKELIDPDEVLHLSSSCPNFLFSPQDSGKLTSLRSIFMSGKGYEGNISHILNHVYLRVLYLVGIQLLRLPESICKLKHLKYLNLSRSTIEVLPESIIYLQNLQVLLMDRCTRLCKLPKGMRFMRNLQHLGNYNCMSLPHFPIGIKELTSLRRLSLFPVGNMQGAQISELGDLNLLEGELEIFGVENVGGLSEAKSAKLKYKRNLLVLKLNWNFRGENKHETIANDEEVLEGFEPNPSLKELIIWRYMGKTISPSWMVNLRNLVEIGCNRCENCEHISSLGRLPCLRVISLVLLDSFKCFHDDDETMSGDTIMFPELRRLLISECKNLVSLPSDLPKLEDLELSKCKELVSFPSNTPKLKVLKLTYCGKLVSLPDEIQSFEDLNELVMIECELLDARYKKNIGVDWPKISHIPTTRFEY